MDLNDLHYFTAIVDAGGISAASRMLGVTKSSLSQHLAQLEQSLGVRLIQRTTRQLVVTPLGLEFHRRCRRVLAEAEHARALIDEVRETPSGMLKVNCPVLFAQIALGPMLKQFMHDFPEVDLVLDADYREVDLIAEGYDMALHISLELRDSSFVVRSFPLDRHILVASRDWLREHPTPSSPIELQGVRSVWLKIAADLPPQWRLFGPDGQECMVSHRPRFVSADPMVVKQGLLANAGVALTTRGVCHEELIDGRLVHLLPEWCGATHFLHAIYPSRQGLSLIARRFLEYLGEHLAPQMHRVLTDGIRDFSIASNALQRAADA